MDTPNHTIAQALAAALQVHHWQMASAESCTGGLIAATCTDLPGSSAWFERGVVSYSNEAKTQLLGVPADLIAREGAVSEAVVRAMAEGLLARCPAQLCVAVTGIAGPTGGTELKPVGTVWMAWAMHGQTTLSERRVWPGDRTRIRLQTVEHVLGQALKCLSTPPGISRV